MDAFDWATEISTIFTPLQIITPTEIAKHIHCFLLHFSQIYYHPTSAIEAAMEGNGLNIEVGMTSTIAITEIRNVRMIDW